MNKVLVIGAGAQGGPLQHAQCKATHSRAYTPQ